MSTDSSPNSSPSKSTESSSPSSPSLESPQPTLRFGAGTHGPVARLRYISPRASTTSLVSPFSPKASTASLGYFGSPTHHRLTSTSSFNLARPPYPSTRLKAEIPKPWLEKKGRSERWTRGVFWGLFGLGWAIAGLICFMGYRSIPQIGNLCLVMQDDFSSTTLDSKHWSHEVRLDGYGNGQFEWTTASTNNSFIQDSTLYLVPTVTSDVLGGDAIVNGYTLNLTTAGTCTSTNVTQCAAVSNSSTGAIINPVQAARIVTRNKVSIKYGKVEVRARMPTGDWIWPAIWMLPETNTYGEWPRSGEIDIAESRGNGPSYGNLGNDHVQSALHWGPVSVFDSYLKTWGVRINKLTGYADKFRTYTLEWNDKYLTTYIDNKVQTTYLLNFDKPFWDRGDYPAFWVNGTDTTRLVNPWFSANNNVAPFDQAFYLILNVAVGGTNGFFPDNLGNKPWQDSSATAMGDFWSARDKWLPTWPTDPTRRGMAVKGVKMWQKC